MSTETETYDEIFVMQTGKGSRYYRMEFRMFPISRKVAEASFAAGATVYRREYGAHVLAANAITRIDG